MGQKGLFFATFTMLVTVCSSSFAFEWQFNPYLGIDAQWRRADFKGGFGDNLFAHTYPQGNAYIGYRLHENIGIELGYEAGKSETRMTTLTTGDVAAGAPILPDVSPAIFAGKGKFQGPHFDIVGFYAPCTDFDFQFIGSIGVAYLKGTFERRTVQLRNTPSGTNRTLSDHKAVLRVAGGLQYMLDEHWGVRGMVGWENTSRMVIFSNDGLPGKYLPEVKPKNSASYSIGILWTY